MTDHEPETLVEAIVVSPTWARKLVESGWSNPTHHYWVHTDDGRFVCTHEAKEQNDRKGATPECWAAPTAEELWNDLVERLPNNDLHVETCYKDGTYAGVRAGTCAWEDLEWHHGDSLKHALANMYCYLAKNHLLVVR